MFGANTEVRAHKASCGKTRKDFECVRCLGVFKGRAALVLHQSHCFDGEWKRNRIKASKRANLGRLQKLYGTDIEVIMSNALESAGLLYMRQYRIDEKSWHVYDFYLSEYKMLVEVDGDFWHGRDGQKEMAWYVKQRQVDKLVSSYAKRRGYKVLRFWGKDVLTDVERCIREVVEYGKNGQRGANWCARSL
jgi:DNA mismatch endonuclease (patch repair protein)